MNNPRKVYVYSVINDYIEPEYIDTFKKMNAELLKGTKETLLAFIHDEKNLS